MGAGRLDPDFPAGTPPHWLPYSQLQHRPDHRAGHPDRRELLGEPLDTDFGRLAVLSDPEGARFAVIQLG